MNLEKYILSSYTPFKDKPSWLRVHFLENCKENTSHKYDDKHSQLLCPNFPFARTEICKVMLAASKTLIEGHSNEDLVDAGKSDFKTVMEISLNIKNEELLKDYQPGDTIGILPTNPSNEVDAILKSLNMLENANDYCTLEVIMGKNKLPLYVPAITTPRKILKECLNIRAVLKKQFLSSLAEFCSNELEKKFLKCLSSKEASKHYNQLFLSPQPLLLTDLLQICSSCKPSLALLVEHLPRLLPRPYSISNSPLSNCNQLQIIFSILPQHTGITTSMLQRKSAELLNKSTTVPPPELYVYLRDINSFRYTAEEDYPKNQILIAIGTGLAPFLGFLEHKQHLKNITNNIPGQTWLFVGAANSILHRTTLVELYSQNILNRYFESVSRDSSASYKYVQDQLRANGKDFVDFFCQPETTLYICADGAEISKSIEACIKECLQAELKIEMSEAEQMVKEFRKNGKYREDLWL